MSVFRNDNEYGFTLVELLVGLVLTVIILSTAVKLLISQRKAFSVQEQVSEMQQYIRSAMDIMTREIRMAGCMVTGTSTIRTSGTSTITFLGDIDSDIAATLVTNANAGTTVVFVSLTPDSNYSIASTDYIYISDGNRTEVTPSDSSASHLVGEPDPIYLSSGLLYSYIAGSTTVRTVENVTFSHDTANLKIYRNSQPLAENIEFISLTYGTNTVTGATNTVTIAITGRTANIDPNYSGDGYRRGTLTSIIKLRNQ